MKQFYESLRIYVFFVLLTGLIYPLFITMIAQTTMPERANGSIITFKKKPIGSKLIAQKFIQDKYFWPRPSACNFETIPSSASNLGPTSKKLQMQVQSRIHLLEIAHPNQKSIPSDLIYASASGIDPHISIKAALYQVDRIVAARMLKEDGKTRIIDLINSKKEKTYVNVLLLNLALDATFKE